MQRQPAVDLGGTGYRGACGDLLDAQRVEPVEDHHLYVLVGGFGEIVLSGSRNENPPRWPRQPTG
ncbi:hypothetical protein EP51_43620 (plasmid) [Rhodococcus opacus]|uniref:Uncharacterized protein n=1 Tax=Rhodococcus opacus TaxID=37919 RepID=A0A076EZY6_RHOOP|nr:hypothetical protein EP51_43620 [Rhodococcus opacus]